MVGELLKKLGIDYPIIQAPMAGGITTPELVTAVSNAGGLGSIGAAYLAPQQIVEAVRLMRSLTSKPFNVNLFAGGYESRAHVDPRPALVILGEIHNALGLPPPVLPALSPDPFPEQLEAVLEARPPVFSFTFGMPDADALARFRGRGVAILGTATTVEEARLLERAGVDAVVAQGAEAGGHRGTFAGPFEAAMIPTRNLVRGVVAAVKLPVIAAGGIMDGRDLAAVVSLGASAAQLGTAFLPCPECGTAQAHKQAILGAATDTTVITRAFSGRPARGLANDFIARFREHDDAILPYPLQNLLTRAMRTAAAKHADDRFLSLWAGQGVTRARALPAAELVKRLLAEMG